MFTVKGPSQIGEPGQPVTAPLHGHQTDRPVVSLRSRRAGVVLSTHFSGVTDALDHCGEEDYLPRSRSGPGRTCRRNRLERLWGGCPELAHLVRNVRRTARPGAHVGVRRQVPRGFPVFCCRGGPLRALLPEGFSRCCPQPGCRSGCDQGPPGGDPGPAPLHGPGHPGDIEHGVLGFAGDREHRQPRAQAHHRR